MEYLPVRSKEFISNSYINRDVAASGALIAYSSAFYSLNQTQDLWPWVLISQVVQCVTIITSCTPYLRPLFDAFQSGMYKSDELRRRGFGSVSGSASRQYRASPTASYALRDVSHKTWHDSTTSSGGGRTPSDPKLTLSSLSSGNRNGTRTGAGASLRSETARRLAPYPGASARLDTKINGGRTGTSEERLVEAQDGIVKSVRVERHETSSSEGY